MEGIASYRFLLPLVPLLLLRVLLLDGELGDDFLQARQRLLPVGLQLAQQRRVRQRRIFGCGMKRRTDGTRSRDRSRPFYGYLLFYSESHFKPPETPKRFLLHHS